MIPSEQSDISIHRHSFWPINGSVGVHQGSQVDGTGAGYPNPPVPRQLVTESPVQGNLRQRHTQTLLGLCRNLGWVVNLSKSELVPQQVFNFVGYHFDLSQGLVKPTQERWIALSQKINVLLGQETYSVRQFMSLIGLLTATEKQVVSGRLHMRPIQWHLKKYWHVPEVLEKIIPLPKSLHVHLRWWLDPHKVL